MKAYVVKLEDKVGELLEDIARNVAKMQPDELIGLFVVKAIAPMNKEIREKLEKFGGEL